MCCPEMTDQAGGQVPRGISVLLTKLDSYFARGALGMRLINVV